MDLSAWRKNHQIVFTHKVFICLSTMENHRRRIRLAQNKCWNILQGRHSGIGIRWRWIRRDCLTITAWIISGWIWWRVTEISRWWMKSHMPDQLFSPTNKARSSSSAPTSDLTLPCAPWDAFVCHFSYWEMSSFPLSAAWRAFCFETALPTRAKNLSDCVDVHSVTTSSIS
jgi:hypothetical protein